jgi:chondroitin AC lyase
MENTSRIQAVMNNKLGICQVAFHRAGEINIPGNLKLRLDSPGVTMLKMRNGKVEELTVSDPTRKLSRMTVTLSGTFRGKGDHFFTIPGADQNSTIIVIDLPQDVYAGKSVTIGLK